MKNDPISIIDVEFHVSRHHDCVLYGNGSRSKVYTAWARYDHPDSAEKRHATATALVEAVKAAGLEPSTGGPTGQDWINRVTLPLKDWRKFVRFERAQGKAS